MEEQQRRDWGSVSLDNCITYDVFVLTDVMTARDMRAFAKHKTTIEKEPSLKTCHIDAMWPDVFVSPTIEDVGEMYLYEFYSLIRNVLIPHIYSVLVLCGARRLHNRLDIFRRVLGNFDVGYANAGQFLDAVQILARTPGGKKIVSDLSKERATFAFEALLPSTFLREDDYIAYQRDFPKRTEPVHETLLLPSWVRNRLAHPENQYEREYPSRHDIERATGLVYAISLALRYKVSQHHSFVESDLP